MSTAINYDSYPLNQVEVSRAELSVPTLINTVDERELLKAKVLKEIRVLQNNIKQHKQIPNELSEILCPSWTGLLKCKLMLAKAIIDIKC